VLLADLDERLAHELDRARRVDRIGDPAPREGAAPEGRRTPGHRAATAPAPVPVAPRTAPTARSAAAPAMPTVSSRSLGAAAAPATKMPGTDGVTACIGSPRRRGA